MDLDYETPQKVTKTSQKLDKSPNGVHDSYFDQTLEYEQDSHDQGSSSEFNSEEYQIEEGKLLSQRNPHFCTPSLLSKFRRLIRIDHPQMYFCKELALPDLQNSKSCIH